MKKRNSQAWVTREWLDPATSRRRREKCPPGTKGVKATDTFVVEWLEPDAKTGTRKRRRSKVAGTGRPAKRSADGLAADLTAHMQLGSYQPEPDDSDVPTWAAARRQYFKLELQAKELAASTLRDIGDTLDRFQAIINPGRLDAITTDVVLEFVVARKKQRGRGGRKLGASTVNKDLRNLRAFFRWCADPDRTLMQRAPKIRMLAEPKTEKPSYTEEEFAKMFEACREATLPVGLPFTIGTWWRTYFACLWETGMRRGELLHIRWSDVDLDRRCLRPVPATTKTKTRLREYSFGDLAAQHLEAMAEHLAGQELLTPDGRVFEWPHDETQLVRQLGKIQKGAGIDPSRRDLKFHAFRRTVGECTTELYGLEAAQHKLGHASMKTTADHYARVALRTKGREAVMPIPEALREKLSK